MDTLHSSIMIPFNYNKQAVDIDVQGDSVLDIFIGPIASHACADPDEALWEIGGKTYEQRRFNRS